MCERQEDRGRIAQERNGPRARSTEGKVKDIDRKMGERGRAEGSTETEGQREREKEKEHVSEKEERGREGARVRWREELDRACE